MEEGQLGDFLKTWQEIVESVGRILKGMQNVSDRLVREMEQMDRSIEPLRKTVSQQEQSIRKWLEGVQKINSFVAEQVRQKYTLTEAATKGLTEPLLRMSQSVRSILEALKDLQGRPEG